MDKLSKLAQEMVMENRYGTKYTYSFGELDAVSRAAACRRYQIESGDSYEKNWPEFFQGRRFYVDGARAREL